MSYGIIINRTPGLIEYQLTGQYSLADTKEAFRFAISNTVKNNQCRILFNLFEITGRIPTLERFEVSEYFAVFVRENALGKIKQVALAGHEPIIDKNRFGETVATNRGLNFKVFTNRSEAIRWLETGS